MTVEVETPLGLRRGSSVFEVQTKPGTDLLTGGTSARSFVRGEAVAVDFPATGLYSRFSRRCERQATTILAHMSMETLDPDFHYDRVNSAKRLRARPDVRPSSPVPASDYPILVTFDDPSDPTTVRLVDPNDLAASFGVGVRLAAVLVEITDDEVTTGLQHRLTWLREDFNL